MCAQVCVHGVCVHKRVYTSVCVHKRVYTSVCVCTSVCTRVCAPVRVRQHVLVCACYSERSSLCLDFLKTHFGTFPDGSVG